MCKKEKEQKNSYNELKNKKWHQKYEKLTLFETSLFQKRKLKDQEKSKIE